MCVQVLPFAGTLSVLPFVGFLAGMTTSPVLISGVSYIEQRTERHRLTEALAWPSIAVSVGITAGSAVTGAIIDAGEPMHGFLVASVGGAIVALTAAAVALAAAVAVTAAHRDATMPP